MKTIVEINEYGVVVGAVIVGHTCDLRQVWKSIIRHERRLDRTGRRNYFCIPFPAKWDRCPSTVDGIHLDHSVPSSLVWVRQLGTRAAADYMFRALQSGAVVYREE